MLIKQDQRGLYFKDSNFVRLLMPGHHVIFSGEIKIFQITQKFEIDYNIDLLLEDKNLESQLNVIKITDSQIGLHYVNGTLTEVLKQGRHIFWKSQSFGEVKIYNLSERFVSPNLTILLTNNLLNSQLYTHEIKDNEIGLYYLDGNFKEVLKPGKHAFWNSALIHKVININLNEPYIAESVDKNILNKPELSAYVNIFVVEPHEKALFYIDKKYHSTLNSGRYAFWNGTQEIKILKVDMRMNQISIAGQEIMTKDKVTLRFNFVAQYKIIDPYIALNQVANYNNEVYTLLQLVLREYVGGFNLDEILIKKEEIGEYVTNKLKNKTLELGVELISSGVKDVILPGEIKDILNQVLIAEKKAQANVIMRREETASTRSLLNTAKLMEDNEVLFKLKELEYIERISEKISQISISGGSHLIEELRQIFIPHKINKDKNGNTNK